LLSRATGGSLKALSMSLSCSIFSSPSFPHGNFIPSGRFESGTDEVWSAKLQEIES
jgi:hypothetical protein